MGPVDDGWLSLQEAADRCGLTYRTLLRIVRRGELAAEKDEGRPYRVRRSEVDAFIDARGSSPASLRQRHHA